MILIAVGIIGFWVMFFSGDAESNMSEVDYKHEKSFPLPDLGWVMPNLFIAAIGLILEENWGFFFSATAGSGMMFLGFIDLAYNLQNDKFKTKDADDVITNFSREAIVDSIYKIDIEGLEAAIDKHNGGPELIVGMDCNVCDNSWKAPLAWNYEHFFSTASCP